MLWFNISIFESHRWEIEISNVDFGHEDILSPHTHTRMHGEERERVRRAHELSNYNRIYIGKTLMLLCVESEWIIRFRKFENSQPETLAQTKTKTQRTKRTHNGFQGKCQFHKISEITTIIIIFDSDCGVLLFLEHTHTQHTQKKAKQHNSVEHFHLRLIPKWFFPFGAFELNSIS